MKNITTKIKSHKKVAVSAIVILCACVIGLTAFLLRTPKITEPLTELDFSTRRLFMEVNEGTEIKEGTVLSQNGNLYLLSFETEEATKSAYQYYAKRSAWIDTDGIVGLADGRHAKGKGTEIKGSLETLQGKTVTEVDTDLIAVLSMAGDEKLTDYVKEVKTDANTSVYPVLNDNGYGTSSSVYAGIEAAIADNADVIVLPFSTRDIPGTKGIEKAVQDAVAKGITVVASAGDLRAESNFMIPGNIEEVVTVGACDEYGVKIHRSNDGQSIDYNVHAVTTAEAASKMAGYIFKMGGVKADGVLVFRTDERKPEALADEPFVGTLANIFADDLHTGDEFIFNATLKEANSALVSSYKEVTGNDEYKLAITMPTKLDGNKFALTGSVSGSNDIALQTNGAFSGKAGDDVKVTMTVKEINKDDDKLVLVFAAGDGDASASAEYTFKINSALAKVAMSVSLQDGGDLGPIDDSYEGESRLLGSAKRDGESAGDLQKYYDSLGANQDKDDADSNISEDNQSGPSLATSDRQSTVSEDRDANTGNSNGNTVSTQARNGESETITLDSKRLLVQAEDKTDLRSDDDVLSDAGDVHLIRYDSEDQMSKAYDYYEEKHMVVTPDGDFVIAANGDITVDDDEILNSDSFKRLKEILAKNVTVEPGAIAVIDTGASASDAVVNRISLIGDDADDDNGHGTKMVNSILSQNPDAKIISIKAMDKNGRGTVSSVYAAIEYAIAQRVSYINLSFTSAEYTKTELVEQALQEAMDYGITVIGAAGNGRTDANNVFPGKVEGVIIAGACDSTGARKSVSNFGSAVDYNLTADSTSEAAALLTGYISKNGKISDVNKNGLIFETSYNVQNIASDDEEAAVTDNAETVTLEETAMGSTDVEVAAVEEEEIVEESGESVSTAPAFAALSSSTDMSVYEEEEEFPEEISDSVGGMEAMGTNSDVTNQLKSTVPTVTSQYKYYYRDIGWSNGGDGDMTYVVGVSIKGKTYYGTCINPDKDGVYARVGFKYGQSVIVGSSPDNRFNQEFKMIESDNPLFVKELYYLNHDRNGKATAWRNSVAGELSNHTDEGAGILAHAAAAKTAREIGLANKSGGNAWRSALNGSGVNAVYNYINTISKLPVPDNYRAYVLQAHGSKYQDFVFAAESMTDVYAHIILNKQYASGNSYTVGFDMYSLEGAEYTIYSNAACTQSTGYVLKTNASGKTNTVNLKPGTYYIKETKASKGCKLDPYVKTVTVTAGTQKLATSDEEVYRHQVLSITKLNDLTGAKLSGAEFDLYVWDKEKNEYVFDHTITESKNNLGTYVSNIIYETDKNNDGNGNVKVKVVEKTAPEGGADGAFASNSGKEIELVLMKDYSTTLKYTLRNPVDDVNIELNKYNEETFKLTDKKEPVSGATFVLEEYNKDTSKYERNSKYTFSWDSSKKKYVLKGIKLTTKNGGYFRIVETASPKDFEPIDPIPVDLNIDHPSKTYQMETGETPAPQRAKIKVTKVDADKKTTRVEGATFKVYEWNESKKAYETEEIDTLTWDAATKTYVSSELKCYYKSTDMELYGHYNLGKFKVVETKQPTGYYMKTPLTKELEFTKAESDAQKAPKTAILKNWDMTNEPTHVYLQKVDAEGKNMAAGVTYLFGPTDEDISTYEEKVSDANGLVDLNYLEPGQYAFKEHKAPEGYKIDQTWRYFTVGQDGGIDGKNKVTYKVYNYPEVPLTITKKDSDGKTTDASTGFPSGTAFAVYEYDKTAKAYKTTPYLSVVYSTAEKKFIDETTLQSPTLAYTPDNQGKFKVVETASTKGYALDETPKEVTVPAKVDTNNKEIKVTFVNKPNNFTITKVSAEAKPIEKVTFNLYKDGEEENVQALTTDKNGIAKAKALSPGIWHYAEVTPADGYQLDKTVYSFVVDEDGRIDGSESTNIVLTNFAYEELKVTKISDMILGDFPAGTEFIVYPYNDATGTYETTGIKLIYNADGSLTAK